MNILTTLLLVTASLLVTPVARAECQDGAEGGVCARNGCAGTRMCMGGRWMGCEISDQCLAPPPRDRIIVTGLVPGQEVGILYDGVDAQGPFNDRRALVTATAGHVAIAVLPNVRASAAGNSMVAFSRLRQPLRASAAWTPGADTITLQPNYDILFAVTFWILSGDFATQQIRAGAAVLAVNNAYKVEAAGVRIALVSIHNAAAYPGAAALMNGGTMQQFQTSIGFNAGAINVYVIANVNGSAGSGINFDGTRVIVLGQDALLIPQLLEHEIGHAFVLGHVGAPAFNWENVMVPIVSGHFLSEGQTFRMHFHPSSQVNVLNWRAGKPTFACGDAETGDCPSISRRLWSDGSLGPN